jgi:hypothetical protein
MNSRYNVGDKVYCFDYLNELRLDSNNNQIVYTIEKDYGHDIYLIGNDYTFIDLVPGEALEEIE